jgi:hypothetical protein
LYWKASADTFTDKTPADFLIYTYNMQNLGPERFPYGVIQFEMSNQAIEVIRIYPTVINLFQKIGGVAQIFLFIFVYFMIYNNEIIIELYLLNFGVLMIPQESKESKEMKEPPKLNQVADVSMKKVPTQAEAEVEGYTYWELLSFRLCSCCSKKSARYKQYRRHKEIIEERMDIVNFISYEGYASLLSKLLMKPYQLKMASHLKTTNQSSEIESLPMERALEMMEQKQSDPDTTEIEAKIN